MSQQVSDPLNHSRPPVSQSPGVPGTRFSKVVIVSWLVLIGMLLLVFSGIFVANLPSQQSQQAHQSSSTRPVPAPPIFLPGNTALPALQLPGGQYIIYEQQNNMSLVSTTGRAPRLISTPGYVYNQAVKPIMTPSGKLLYSGNGLWLADPLSGTSTRIAPLAPDSLIASLTLSDDGKSIAWSTEPIDGKGVIDIYTGSLTPLTAPTLVYEQSTANCPCYRVFGFLHGSATTLLLTDGRGSHDAVQYGLWTLNLSQVPSARPQLLLNEDRQQGPLALAPSENILLYSSSEGTVPIPTDKSVPGNVATLSYANSLDLTTISGVSGQSLTLSTPQVLLPEQHNLSNDAQYHWVTTPTFAPDGQTLAYVEFSSDTQDPYDRHSSLYTVQFTGSGTQMHASRPQLLATSSALFVELGAWLNNSVVTFYADGRLYALDVDTGAATTIGQTVGYARIVGVM